MANKGVKVVLSEDYNPNLMRKKITRQYQERFFKIFASNIDFEKTVSEEERIVILKQLWEFGSFSVSRSPSPLEAFDKEMDLTFTKYAVDDFDFNLQPLYYHNAPLKSSRAVKRGKLTVGKDGVIVYLNEYARLHRGCGAAEMAKRYINQIVNVKMTIQTNLLLHKMPFFIACDDDESNAFQDILRKVFSDEPAIYAPSMMSGNAPQALQTSAPYIIDKLDQYATKLENMYLDEIGVDNAKPIASGQDRLLMDEANANNAAINDFSGSMFSTLQAGFDEVETLFGKKITVKPRSIPSLSIHEEINGEGESEPKEEENQND